MARRWKKDVKFYDYICSLTGEKFRMAKEAKSPDQLTSVKAYYELHPQKDDRPEVIKKKAQADEITRVSYSVDEEGTPPAKAPLDPAQAEAPLDPAQAKAPLDPAQEGAPQENPTNQE